MVLKKWDDLPEFMKCKEVKPYHHALEKKRGQLFLKRCLDLALALIMIVILAVPMMLVALVIKLDSSGPVFFRQERVTAYGKIFRIHKFRTMVCNADKIGAGVTTAGDKRVTGVGSILRRLRIDEIPQLFDVLSGNMSFVGTRPEIPKYVRSYTKEMYATFLLPAGITSEASIRFKDEGKLLSNADDIDKTYVEQILPAKMAWNLKSIKRFSLWREVLVMLMTVIAVCDRN